MIFEKQDYQQKCIKNLVEVLKKYDFNDQNLLNLKSCLKDFYISNPQPIDTFGDSLNLDILMETGTGKTFTYLNAIFEINKVFKQNKFIIYVPRKAILESVKQNIELTKDYFYKEYKKHLKSYFYTGKNSISDIINHYIGNNNELSVLVLTNSSIDKEGNILNKANENIFGYSSIVDKIISLKPICFLDEPHLLKGEKFYEIFSKFNTLYFRFGATYPKDNKHRLSNLIYSLDSISAFENYLVKQIKVNTIYEKSHAPKLLLIDRKNKSATFSYDINNLSHKANVGFGDDLGQKLHYSKLDGVNIIKSKGDEIFLSNNETIKKTNFSYTLDDSQIYTLISTAIDLHFKKEEFLFLQGIKALCLFFIPNIADFRGDNPRIKNMFESIYKQKREEILKAKISKEYKEYLLKDFDSNGNLRVAQGYFSGDKGSNNEEKEALGIELILKDKENLLSFSTPLRFIFSVWALQEGWDNPNIFTLVKLASNNSDISRHQQVGRGLRLCVNQEGKRITYKYLDEDENKFYDINSLDVVISNEEALFIEELQREIRDNSFSIDKDILIPSDLEILGFNERQKSKFLNKLEDENIIKFDETNNYYIINQSINEALKNNKEFFLNLLGDELFDKTLKAYEIKNKTRQIVNQNEKQKGIKIRKNNAIEFKKLWDTINKKSSIVYKNINEDLLIDEIVTKFNECDISEEQITHTTKILNKENEIKTQSVNIISKNFNNKFSHLNLLKFADDTKLPLNFVLKLFAKLDTNKLNKNSKQSMEKLEFLIKDQIHSFVLKSVSYEFNDTLISNDDLLYDKNGVPKDEIIPYTKLGKFIDENNKTRENYLYEQTSYDSQIELDIIKEGLKEVNDCSIEVYAKLPRLKIPTPYKNYEPDFAYLINTKDNKKIFFICESKGYDNEEKIPADERKKIRYAEIFFKSLQDSLKDENIKIIFKTRINNQELSDILRDIKDKK